MSPHFDITLFYAAFLLYFVGFLAFAISAGVKGSGAAKVGVAAVGLGLLPHTAAFFTRWHLSGHVPLSNMYEYLSVMGWAAVVALLVVYYKYRRSVIGVLLSPLVFMLMVAAALLPKDLSQSLMPALQSFWLQIHVSLAALGSGCFLIAFGASLVYMLRNYQPEAIKPDQFRRMKNFARLYLLLGPVAVAALAAAFGFLPPAPMSKFGSVTGGVNLGSGMILLGLTSIVGLIIAGILWPSKKIGDRSGFGGWLFAAASFVLLLGGLLAGLLIKLDFLALTHQLPTQTGSVKSGWLIFEFLGAAYLLAVVAAPLVFPILSKTTRVLRASEALQLNLLDEISYKTVSIGYPLYTVGALFAGAIWAEQAWGQFWSWDPKEVGALVIWLFYSGYLHARYQRGWSGTPAAMLVVAGFLMVLLSFFGNYFFGGLHAYA